MGSQSVPEDSLPTFSSQTSSQASLTVGCTEVQCDSIPVKCGTASGCLYLDEFIASGSKRSQKCILSNSVWYTPIELVVRPNLRTGENQSTMKTSSWVLFYLPLMFMLSGVTLPPLELLVPLVLSGRSLVNLLTQF